MSKERSTPLHVADQVDAAEAETQRDFRAWIAETPGATIREVTENPVWLRELMADALRVFFEGRASTCVHLLAPDVPQPVVAASWRPGLVVCPDCTHLFAQRTAAFRCIGCDAAVDHIGVQSHSVLVYQYGVCPGCLPSA